MLCSLIFLVISLFLVLICVILVYFEMHRRRMNYQFRHIPGTKQYPIVGNMFNTHQVLEDFNPYVDALSMAPIAKMVVPGHLILGISDPTVLQQILNSQAFIGRVKYFLRFTPWDESMLTAACPIKWRYLRKMIQPAFSHKNLLTLVPTFNKHLCKINQRLEELSKTGETFDFYLMSNKIGMEQALEIMLNTSNVDPKVMEGIFKKIVDNTCERVMKIQYHNSALYNQTSKGKETIKMCDVLEDIFQKAVENVRADPEGKTVLHYLLKQEEIMVKQLSLKQIMDNALIMFGAGYETTAITISHIVLMLALHPEVDLKVFEELTKCLKGQETAPIDYNFIKKLTYLDMVIKETLRLFPTVPIVLRQAVKDEHIDSIGLIPKGTILIPVLYQLHRWKHIWGADADKFNPENFLPENISKRHPCSYLPFSMGPRNCIGIEHAQLNLKLALIHMLSHFRFETDLTMKEFDVRFSVFLRLRQGYPVRVYRR